MRASKLLLVLALCVSLLHGVVVPSAALAAPVAAPQLNVQRFLDGQPGVLKSYREGKYSAAQAIEAYSSYYSLDPRIILTLLELGPRLLTERNPAPETIRLPFGAAGPAGFTAQVEWAVREIRAGFGPYTTPPSVTFADGATTTLDLGKEASVIAVQRFLARGRAEAEWRGLVDRYEPLYKQLWGAEPAAPTPTPIAARPFLHLPWPAGVPMIHSSYFDHVFPTVDRGADDNDFIVNYLGRGNLSYNTHDGHDYYFPEQPIGTPILAAAGGTAYAYTTPGNGVVIRHGGAFAGYETVYWHLDQFAAIFSGKIDNGAGVRVEAGTVLGVSGKSGFTDGGAHLHFEVRHNGKQVDPYGWYGPGPDPCAAWSAGCEASVWLWHDSLSGTYDFTRPDAPAPEDHEPPTGSLAVSPDEFLGLLAHFDGTPVPTIGKGFPQINGTGGARPSFGEGVFGEGLQVSQGVELSYPISGNLELERGTLALWAQIPEAYPNNTTGRHYLFATSANPEDGKVYTDTLALRRETGENGPVWNFWTVDGAGVAHSLTTPDTLRPGSWHHFAVTWQRDRGSKALFIDGQRVAQTSTATLPGDLGERLQLGRFIATFGVSGVTMDELAVFRRVLSPRELQRLAARQDLYSSASGPIGTARVVTDRSVVLDANAIDQQGGIVSVQLRRGEGEWTPPLAYHDDFRWTIQGDDGEHSFSIRYRDRADNETIVTMTLTLAPPLYGSAVLRSATDTAAVIGLDLEEVAVPSDWPYARLSWLTQNVELQLSNFEDFRDATWESYAERRVWNWQPDQQRVVYVRFRDHTGRVSAAIAVGPDLQSP